MTGPYDSQYPGENSEHNQDGGWQSNYGQPDSNAYGNSSGYPGDYPGVPTNPPMSGYQNGYNYATHAQATPPVPPHIPQPKLSEVQFRPFDIGDTFSQAWKGFAASWVPWVVSTLIFYGVSFISMIALVFPMMGGLMIASDTSNPELLAGAMGVGGIIFFIAFVVYIGISVVWTLNCYRNAYRVIRGETIGIADFFKFKGLGTSFLLYLSLIVVIGIGMVLLWLPGIVLSVILSFALTAVFHLRDGSVGEAFKASWKIVSKNFGSVLLLLIAVIALNVVGSMVIVGILLTAPLTYLLFAHAFQTAIGAPAMRRA